MSHMDTRMSWEPDKPHEECGVFGMYDLDGNDVASSIQQQEKAFQVMHSLWLLIMLREL